MEERSVTDCAREHRLFIVDACVLIDFIKADSGILILFSKFIGDIHISSTMVSEIREVKEERELIDVGIKIVEPTIEDAYTATAQIGGTSFQDRLCMLIAKRHGFTCVTNDAALRKLCQREKVAHIRGLRLLADLCSAGGIPRESAIEIAEQIHRDNPKHITGKIVEDFKDILKSK